jgi:hypothetical protein
MESVDQWNSPFFMREIRDRGLGPFECFSLARSVAAHDSVHRKKIWTAQAALRITTQVFEMSRLISASFLVSAYALATFSATEMPAQLRVADSQRFADIDRPIIQDACD